MNQGGSSMVSETAKKVKIKCKKINDRQKFFAKKIARKNFMKKKITKKKLLRKKYFVKKFTKYFCLDWR